jgi:hypothetical protein
LWAVAGRGREAAVCDLPEDGRGGLLRI